MKAIMVLAVLAVLLIGCSDDGLTGGAVIDSDQEVQNQLSNEVASLQGEISALKEDLAARISALNEKDTVIDGLKAELSDVKESLRIATNTVESQKKVLREMDVEREEAVTNAVDCDDTILELQEKNDVLKRWVDICRDELDVALD